MAPFARPRLDAKERRLAALPLFAECTPDELHTIAALGDEIDVPAGTVLMREGAPGLEAFIVLDGTAAVTRKRREVATVGAGEWLGELALLSDAPRIATVVASTPMRLIAFDRRSFATLLRAVPVLTNRLLPEVAHRIVALAA